MIRGAFAWMRAHFGFALVLLSFVVIPLILFMAEPTVWRLFVLWVGVESILWWVMLRRMGVVVRRPESSGRRASRSRLAGV